MTESWWILAGCGFAAVIVLAAAWWPMRSSRRDTKLADARKEFHRQREWLEVRFIQSATSKAKPGSPRWADCDFDNDVAYVRNRATSELSAFVGITIAFDDAPGSSGTSGYGNLRMGTAVFRFTGQRWDTDGRAILNLSPAEAIRFYHEDLEMVAQEVLG